MPILHRTPNTIKSLTLKLSLAEGVAIGDLQGKRYRITVPLNGLVFDNHAATPAWFYAVFPPQLGSGSAPVPEGIRLTGSQPVMTGADSGDPRQAIVSRLTFDIEFAADAVAFEALPLVVKGFAAATNAPASFSLPAFTPSPDAPFMVADADGGALATGITVEELSVIAGDSELLQGENGDYYLDRANHTGTQAISTVSGLGSALDELAQASLPPGGSAGQVLAKASGIHYDAEWVDTSGGGTGVGNQRPIVQAGHGLSVGHWVRHDGTAYVKAQANSAGNAEVLGVVTTVDGTDDFTLASDGYVEGLSGLTPGSVYFLSPDAAGEMAASEPAAIGQVSRPVFIAVSSTAGYILNYRGYVVPANEEDDGDADTLEGEAGEFYLDRANHTGTQAIGTVSGLQAALDGKASTSHTHSIGNVTGLQTALDGKASTSHRSSHVSGGADAFLTTDLIEAIVRRLRESGGTTLTMGSVANGQYLYRSGNSIVGGTPTGNVSVSVKSSGQQVIDDSTNTAVTFDQEEWDTHNMHSTSSNTSRLVVPSGQGGNYLVMGQVAFDNNATGHRNLKIRVNGNSTTWLAKSNQTMLGSTDCQWLQVSKVLSLAAGDYVELIAYQNSGVTINIGIGVDEGGNDETSWFQMTKIS